MTKNAQAGIDSNSERLETTFSKTKEADFVTPFCRRDFI